MNGDRLEQLVPIRAVPVGLRGEFVTIRCACCGKDFEAFRGYLAQDEDARTATCSEACDRRVAAAAKARERSAPFDAMLGANFAAPFDRAKFPGKPEAVERVMAWRPEPDRPFLLLNGVTDKGKTRLGVMALRASYERTGLLPVIVWPGELSLMVAEAWGEVQARALRDRLVGASVLMLDDVDKDKFTERTAEMLFAVLDARLRHGRPTIVTLNASEAAFESKFPNPEAGRATLRRLKKHGTTVTP